MKRISINLRPEQDAALKERTIRDGVPKAEQIRRAINLVLFADAQGARKTKQQPVLFYPNKETR